MIRTVTRIVGMLMLTALITSCGQHAAGNGTPRTTPDDAHSDSTPGGRVILALVDATGSFKYLRESFTRLARVVVTELRGGDTFAVGFIKDTLVETDYVVPFTTPPTPTRPIGDLAEVEALALQREMQETLTAYANVKQYRKVMSTDINQAVAYAGRLLRDDRREKWLLLSTDLEDNQHQHVEWHLAGVHVRIFFVPARGSMRTLEQTVQEWERRFTDAGVASVQIYDVGQTRALPAWLTPSEPGQTHARRSAP